MSDRELRKILRDVIDDLDAGRVRAPVQGLARRLGRRAAPPLLAAALGLGGLACDARSVGQSYDAGTSPDATAQVDAAAGPTDAMTTTTDAQPQLDAGSVLMYGEPWLDAGAVDDYGVPPIEPDAGDIDLYGVPPSPDVDGGIDALYAAPGCEPSDPDRD